MLIYYIIVVILIILTSYLQNKFKSNWKYFPIVITILTFLSPRIYDAYNKVELIPDFDARIYAYDIAQDSVLLKFEIENIGTGKATNIWHITSLNENQFGDNLKTIKKINPREKYTIFSFCRFNTKIEGWMKPVLYLGYRYEENNQTKTVYKKFVFLITNTKNSGSYSKTQTIEPREIKSFEALFDSLGGIKNRLSMEDGSVLLGFNPNDYYNNPVIAMSKDKKILYNTVDSNVYFVRPYNEQLMIVLSDKINKNYKGNFHTFLISWNDSSTFLDVDNQGLVNDSIIRYNLTLNPSKTLRDYGINWFNKKDYFDAIISLENSLKLDKKNHFITYEKLFLSYDAIGSINKGIEILKKAIEVGHLDSSIVLNLAMAYENIHDYKKACEMYDLDHRNSKSATGFIRDINLQNELGNYAISKTIFLKGIKIYPRCNQLWGNFGITSILSGDTTLALKLFGIALKLNPKDQIAIKNYKQLDSLMKNHGLN